MMKKEWEITDKYLSLDIFLKKAEDKYNKLDQISMCNDEGNKLREKINKIKGEINAFKWILNI